jgi:hypothetical protein
MTISVEKLQDEPIIVYRYPKKLESNQELRDALVAENNIVQKLPDPVVWVIHDVSQLTINFSSLISGLVTLTKEGPEGFDDPRLRIAAVSKNEWIRFAAQSASQRQYGGWQISIFDTYEQALAHVREDLAKRREQG